MAPASRGGSDGAGGTGGTAPERDGCGMHHRGRAKRVAGQIGSDLTRRGEADQPAARSRRGRRGCDQRSTPLPSILRAGVAFGEPGMTLTPGARILEFPWPSAPIPRIVYRPASANLCSGAYGLRWVVMTVGTGPSPGGRTPSSCPTLSLSLVERRQAYAKASTPPPQRVARGIRLDLWLLARRARSVRETGVALARFGRIDRRNLGSISFGVVGPTRAMREEVDSLGRTITQQCNEQ
jgi:hypothetical protein